MTIKSILNIKKKKFFTSLVAINVYWCMNNNLMLLTSIYKYGRNIRALAEMELKWKPTCQFNITFTNADNEDKCKVLANKRFILV